MIKYNLPQNIYNSAIIGEHCTIGCFVEIGADVCIGDFCSIQAFAYIPEGVTIGKNVFVGPHTCFTNCKYPSANKKDFHIENSGYATALYEKPKFKLEKTIVEDNVVIGANCTILPGITIGKGAIIGAGTVVTKDVKAGETFIDKKEKHKRIIIDMGDNLNRNISYIVGTVAISDMYKADCIRALGINFTKIVEE